jgi:hypothetical protein
MLLLVSSDCSVLEYRLGEISLDTGGHNRDSTGGVRKDGGYIRGDRGDETTIFLHDGDIGGRGNCLMGLHQLSKATLTSIVASLL